MSGRPPVDAAAVARGAAPALAVTATAGVAANLLDVAGESSPLAVALLVVMLAGLGVGGWVAARSCRRAPLIHGAAASLAAVAVLLAVNLVRRLAGDGDVDGAYGAYAVVWALLALACGLAGALAALGTPRRRPSAGSSAGPGGRAESHP